MYGSINPTQIPFEFRQPPKPSTLGQQSKSTVRTASIDIKPAETPTAPTSSASTQGARRLFGVEELASAELIYDRPRDSAVSALYHSIGSFDTGEPIIDVHV